MPFGIEADSFRPEHPSCTISQLPDGVVKTAGSVENLNPKVHGIHHEQLLAAQTQLRRIVEFDLARALLPNRRQHAALHIHHINLVAQRVGDVNALGRRVHRDSRGALEKSFPAFQAADHSPELAAGVKHEDLACLRVGHINIVLRIHRNALRREHRIFAAVFAGKKLVLFFGEVKDVNPVGPGVGNDDASVRIGRDAVGFDQKAKLGLARDDIDHAIPETALRLHLAFQAEAAFEREFPTTVEQQVRRRGTSSRLRLTGGSGRQAQ